jgi:alpha-D-xyloside xylohydrolase
MVAELAETGTKLMVSVWPSVSPLSGNYDRMRADGLLVGTEYGPVAHADWPDKGVAADVQVAFYDPTNPRARAFVWDRVAENYLSYGIDVFWLDACEPEMRPHFPANLRYHAGPGLEVGNLYPQQHARAFHDGLTAAGRDVVTLNRSAWAGSQRYGAALWSGDIGADFATLRAQVAAGLNVALSGIPWWTTDIGGFHGGDPDSPGYRELMVRWFQYGACCPLFRLHGDRDPRDPHGVHRTGGPNEIWSYGDEVYPVLRDYILLRERLRPYLADQFRLAHETGLPPMRPLFVDFPTDDAAWLPADEYLLGPDLLVAPVLAAGARHRDVYLPAGTRWRDAWTGTVHPGGTTVTADAPLDRIPLFLRGTANLPIRA